MGQLLSNLANGSFVKLNENGHPEQFIKLGNDHYGAGTGVTMLRKKAYTQTAWNAASTYYNVFIGCTLDNICDGIFPQKLDEEIRACMVSTPIVVAQGMGVATLHTIYRKAFPLSCTEVGLSGWQTEGKAFALFVDNASRIAYLDGTEATAVYWGLRSPYSVTNSAYCVHASGALIYDHVNNPHFAARPAFNLKSSIVVSSNKDSDGCYTVESTPAQSNRLYVKYNGIWREAG